MKSKKLNTWWEERIAVSDTDISRKNLFEIFSKTFELDNKNLNIKQQINESMKELIKEEMDISNLSDEQQTKLIKDVSSILIKIIQLHEYCATELRDSNLTHKVGKAKSYMEDFSNYLTAHRVGEGSGMDIDQEEQRVNLHQRNPDEDRGVVESKNTSSKDKWKIKLNLKEEWVRLNQEIEKNNFSNTSSNYKNFVKKLRTTNLNEAKLHEDKQLQYNKLINYLQESENIEDFNMNLNDLYDWADYNNVYIEM